MPILARSSATAHGSNNSFSKLHIAVDDVSAGYNNLPTDSEYVTCAGDDEVKAARFYTSRVMMFGSTASVNHFCRLPSLIERLGARLLMMMILLLFLQKQNLAFAVYQFGSVLSLPD